MFTFCSYAWSECLRDLDGRWIKQGIWRHHLGLWEILNPIFSIFWFFLSSVAKIIQKLNEEILWILTEYLNGYKLQPHCVCIHSACALPSMETIEFVSEESACQHFIGLHYIRESWVYICVRVCVCVRAHVHVYVCALTCQLLSRQCVWVME